MKPHHVRVHALGVNRVAADLTEHRVAGIRNGLLDQRFGSGASATPAFVLRPRAFRAFPCMRPFFASTATSRIRNLFSFS